MLSPKTSQGVPLHEGCQTREGDGSDEEGHRRDEGEHEKGESRR